MKMPEKTDSAARAAGKVFIRTFGCQMNRHDSDLIAGSLQEKGWELTREEKDARIILLNTCGVRDHAERRVWGKLSEYGRRKSRGEELVVGVVGCMAQLHGREIWDRHPSVDFIAGPGSFAVLPEILASCADRLRRRLDLEFQPAEEFYRNPRRLSRRARAAITVSRGCDNFCSYCVVPYARGREDCRPPESIITEARGLAEQGCREITLLGQNVNSYRARDQRGREVDFPALLEAVSRLEGLARLRFLTSHPRDISPALIEKMAGLDKVCQYLHFPAQSGSDRILAAMNRGYNRREYLAKVELVRRTVPGVALSSDFIVGFPGEAEEDFNQTLSLLKEVGFDQAFLFKYSPRPRTAAARLNDDVPDPVKQERLALLLREQERISLARNQALVGSEVEVLAEGASKSDQRRRQGRTKTNKIVIFPREAADEGQIVRLTVNRATPLALYADPSL